MRTPTIHTNGTSQEELLEQNTRAAQAVQTALQALAEAAPNQRDYYPQGHEAWLEAAKAHQSRQARLMDVMNELRDLAEAIADA